MNCVGRKYLLETTVKKLLIFHAAKRGADEEMGDQKRRCVKDVAKRGDGDHAPRAEKRK